MTRIRPLFACLLSACLAAAAFLVAPAMAQAAETIEFASGSTYATNGFSHPVQVNVAGGTPSTPIQVLWSLNKNSSGAAVQTPVALTLNGSGAGSANLTYTPSYAPGTYTTDVISAVCADNNQNNTCDVGEPQPTVPTTHSIYVGEPNVSLGGTNNFNTGASTASTVTVTSYGDGTALGGVGVKWSRSGVNASASGTLTTSASGQASIPSWTDTNPGTDSLRAWVDDPLGISGTYDAGEGTSLSTITFTAGTIQLSALNPYYLAGGPGTTATATVYSDGNNGAQTPTALVGASVSVLYRINSQAPVSATTNASSQIQIPLNSATPASISLTVWRDVVTANSIVDSGEPYAPASTNFSLPSVSNPSISPASSLGVGENMTFSFRSNNYDTTALPTQQVCWLVSAGPDTGRNGSTQTDGGGNGTVTYTGSAAGFDTFNLWLGSQSPCGTSLPGAGILVTTLDVPWQMAIVSGGPVNAVYIGDTMACGARYILDTSGEFFGNTYGPASCRPYVFVDGVQRFPIAVSQTGPTPISGGGYEIDTTTCVSLTSSCPNAPDPLMTQKVTYFPGSNYYRVDYAFQDRDSTSHTVRIYQYADCYLQNSDSGFGHYSAVAGGGNGGIYCTANPDNQPSGRIEGFVPLDAGAAYYEAGYGTVDGAISNAAVKPYMFDNGLGVDVSNTCDCSTAPHSAIDNGMAIGWEASVPANGTLQRALLTDFSPNGTTADIYPPNVTLDVPADNSTTTETQPTFSGQAGTLPGDSGTVTVNVYAGSAASGSPVAALSAAVAGGAWSVQAGSPLALGTYTAQAVQSDQAGNVGRSAPRTFTVAAPAAAAASSSPAAATTSSSPTQPPTAPPPLFARAVDIEPVSGVVLVRVPGGKFVKLTSPEQVRVGTIIDARHGRVRLTTVDKQGHIQFADFYLGEFQIQQLAKDKGVTTLKLVGGNFGPCGKGQRASKAEAAAAKKVVQQLWGSGHGKFRTKGRFASATIRGTTWDTVDRCDGTLIKVTAGAVTVHDFAKNKDIVVKKGQRYLANP